MQRAWSLRDEIEDRDASVLGSPVDYAPHWWRQIQERLTGYERILRSGLENQQLVDLLETSVIPALESLRDGRPPHRSGAEAIRKTHESSPAFDTKLANPDPRSLAMTSHFPWRRNQLAVENDAQDIRDSIVEGGAERIQTAWHEDAVELRWPEWIDMAQVNQDSSALNQLIAAGLLGEQAAGFASWCAPVVREDVSLGDDALWRALRDHPSHMVNHTVEAAGHFENAILWGERVDRLIRLRNDLVFRAPFYVRWYESNQRIAVSKPTLAQLNDLFRRVTDVSALLDRLLAGKNDASETPTTLREIADGLEDARKRIEAPLNRARLEGLDKPEDIGEIDALLSTPLLGASERRLLIDKLDTLEPDVAAFDPQSVPIRRTPKIAWNVAHDRAELALELLGTTMPNGDLETGVADNDREHLASKLDEAEEQFGKFGDSISDVAESNGDAPWREVEQLGETFRECYAMLQRQTSSSVLREWQPTKGSDPSNLGHYERVLRVLDARDAVVADAVRLRRHAELYQLFQWHRQRFLQAIDGASDLQAQYLADSATAYADQAAALFDQTTDDSIGNSLRANSLSVTSDGALDFSRFDVSNDEAEPQLVQFSIVSPTSVGGNQRLPVWVAARYDDRLLEVEGARNIKIYRYDPEGDGGRPTRQDRHSFLLTPGGGFELDLIVKPLLASSRRTRLVLEFFVEATLAARPDEETMVHTARIVRITPPTPNIARLVVLESDSDSVARPTEWQFDGRTLELAPFPNTEAFYRFGLVNTENRTKRVRVALHNADENFQPLDPPFATASNVDLPASDPSLGEEDIQPIAFEPYEEEPTGTGTDNETTGGGSSNAVAEPGESPPQDAFARPALGNLICVIEELAEPESNELPGETPTEGNAPPSPAPAEDSVVVAETTYRIDIRPRRPRSYLNVSPDFDPQRRVVSFHIRPTKSSDLPPEGSQIVWDRNDAIPSGSKQILPEDASGNFSASLTRDGPGEVELYANVRAARDRTVIVSLTVDDCPRAFVYRVDCRRGDIEKWSSIAPEVRIIRSETDKQRHAVYDSRQSSVPIEVRVNSPDDALSKRAARVGIDRDRDGSLGRMDRYRVLMSIVRLAWLSVKWIPRRES